MTLWRLELLRLLRTRRAIALAAVYLFFGFVGPFAARYLEEILTRFGNGIAVEVPDPAPADGIVQFSSNVQQIGLLVVLIVAVGALAVDARPALAAFFRTRVRSMAALLIPRYVVAAAGAAAAFALGTAAAWYESVVLLGPLPTGGMLAGIAYGMLYLAFAIAVAAFATTLVRGRSSAVAIAVVILLSLPVAGLIPDVAPWLPSHLAGALDSLAAGSAAADYLRSAAVTLGATAALLTISVRRLARREV